MADTTVTEPTTTSQTLATTQTKTEPPPPTVDWMSSFSPEQKLHAQNKGWKSITDAVEAHRNAEKHFGHPTEKIFKIPEKWVDDKGEFTPEAHAAYEKLGRPKDPTEYGIDKIQGVDAKVAEEFSKYAHKQGLTKAQAEALVKFDVERAKAFQEVTKQRAIENFKAQDDALKKEWGAAFDQNKQIAKEGALRLGMKVEQIDALASVMGHKDAMNFLKNLGVRTGEAEFVRGSQSPSTMEPKVAEARLKELEKSEEHRKALFSSDALVREKAMEEFRRVARMAKGESA